MDAVTDCLMRPGIGPQVMKATWWRLPAEQLKCEALLAARRGNPWARRPPGNQSGSHTGGECWQLVRGKKERGEGQLCPVSPGYTDSGGETGFCTGTRFPARLGGRAAPFPPWRLDTRGRRVDVREAPGPRGGPGTWLEGTVQGSLLSSPPEDPEPPLPGPRWRRGLWGQ